jgi:hypothetical protein
MWTVVQIRPAPITDSHAVKSRDDSIAAAKSVMPRTSGKTTTQNTATARRERWRHVEKPGGTIAASGLVSCAKLGSVKLSIITSPEIGWKGVGA